MRVTEDDFTDDEIAHCKAAMAKPAPLGALRLIASGRVIGELSRDRREVLLDRLDGKEVRDWPDHPDTKMGIAGSWPLYRAGMIDQFCVITPAGRSALAQETGEGVGPSDPLSSGYGGGNG